jgi:hypothetical protein
MAKKAKNPKKHQLKYSSPTGSAENRATTVAQSKEAILSGRDFSYVSGDVKRLALMAGSLLAIEFALWYAMGHTGLGNAVYNLIKL